MSETELKTKWVLLSIFCISCGQNLGIRMTQSTIQDYNYCRKCYRDKLEHDFDLEKSYNQLNIHAEHSQPKVKENMKHD